MHLFIDYEQYTNIATYFWLSMYQTHFSLPSVRIFSTVMLIL